MRASKKVSIPQKKIQLATAVELYRLSRPKFYQLMQQGRLVFYRLDKKIFLDIEEIESLMKPSKV